MFCLDCASLVIYFIIFLQLWDMRNTMLPVREFAGHTKGMSPKDCFIFKSLIRYKIYTKQTKGMNLIPYHQLHLGHPKIEYQSNKGGQREYILSTFILNEEL